jgi:hypothetical protein
MTLFVRPALPAHAFRSEPANAIEDVIALDAMQQPAPPPRLRNDGEFGRVLGFVSPEAKELLAGIRLSLACAEQTRRRVMQKMIAFSTPRFALQMSAFDPKRTFGGALFRRKRSWLA